MQEIKGKIQEFLRSDTLSTQEKNFYQGAAKELGEYEKQVAQVIDMVSTDQSLATTMMAPAENKFQVLNTNLQGLWELENKLSKEKYVFSGQSFLTVVQTFFVVLAAAIVLSVLTSIFLSRLVTFHIRQTIEVVKKVAEGDLTREIRISGKDEIGELAQAVNAMRLKMGEAVGQSAATSQNLSEAASEQAAAFQLLQPDHHRAHRLGVGDHERPQVLVPAEDEEHHEERGDVGSNAETDRPAGKTHPNDGESASRAPATPRQ